MDDKLKKRLFKRNYAVYEGVNPPPELMEKLRRKKVAPLRRDEWLAVLVYHREHFIKGPTTAPYVPANRVLKR